MKRIQYIGIKEKKGDNVAGTNLTWEQNQVHDVGDIQAAMLLKFPSVWKEAKPDLTEAPVGLKELTPITSSMSVDQIAEAAKLEKEQAEAALEAAHLADKEAKERESAATFPDVHNMEQPALVELAKTRYNQDVRANANVTNLRQQIVAWENSGQAILAG
jgi:hypothetical protein